jgi:hypothetical protein
MSDLVELLMSPAFVSFVAGLVCVGTWLDDLR